MREKLQSQAQQALLRGDYALAAKNYIQGNSLPHEREKVKDLYLQVNELNESTPNANLYAILGLIALDDHEVFEKDREEALMQCVQWSCKGIELDPDNRYCYRNAGSALYWLDDWTASKPYYEKAIALAPSPVLQIRLFNMANRNRELPDFSKLALDIETEEAMEAYNAGVELDHLIEGSRMPELEQQRLTVLKQLCYKRAYVLYRDALAEEDVDSLNGDPLTFAMCCNNLAGEAIRNQDYESAITLTGEGMRYHVFPYILMNRIDACLEAGHHSDAIVAAKSLLDTFGEELDLLTYFYVIDQLCASTLAVGDYEDLMKWVNIGLQIYYTLDTSDPITTEPEVVRCFTNFFIYKANAENALGIKHDAEDVAQDTDQLLESMPDNPSLLISRANTFIEAGNFDKALECYQYAIHFAIEKQMVRSMQVALYNMGYMQAVHLGDIASAFDSFEQSISAGNEDFWCYYWGVYCAYDLQENESTIHYAQCALEKLQQQEGIDNSIVAELYDRLGVAQLDLGLYVDAADHLSEALKYSESATTRANLKIAQENQRADKGFFGKLFGK